MPYKDITKQKQAQHESYVRNKAKIAVLSKEKKLQRKEFVSKIKESSPCLDCGVYYPYYVMEFDHLDPSEKIDAISRLINKRSNLEKIMDEIAKCDLVCSNCHRQREHGRRQNF